MNVHSLHQYLIPTYIWYEVTHWWKVSQGCCIDWRFYEYRNVSWRSTPEIAGCQFEMQILIMDNKESQKLHGKGTKQRLLVQPRDIYAHEIFVVLVWTGIEMKWHENCHGFLFFLLERYFLSKIWILVMIGGQIAAVDYHYRVGLV